MATALTLPERAAVALGTAEHEVKLIALAKESADIVAVTNAAGRDQAHRIGMNLRTTRTTIQNIGKDARDDATKFSKAIIAEENRLISIIQPEETRVIGLRDGFDAEEKARKDAKIAAERARVDSIQLRISHIRNKPLTCVAALPATIRAHITEIEDIDCNDPQESFAEFVLDAKDAKQESLAKMGYLLDKSVAYYAAAAAAEEARIAEADRQQAEREELAAAQAKMKADQEAQAAKQAAFKAAQDAFNARIAAHEAALAAEDKVKQDAVDAAIRLDADHAEALELNAALALVLAVEYRQLDVGTAPISMVDPVAAPNTSAPTLTLGKIGARLGFALTADFLRSIGFEPAGRERAAVLYHENDWQDICDALIAHIDRASEIQRQAA